MFKQASEEWLQESCSLFCVIKFIMKIMFQLIYLLLFILKNAERTVSADFLFFLIHHSSRIIFLQYILVFMARQSQGAYASSMRFLDHLFRHIISCIKLTDDRSARRRDLYLTTHNTHNSHQCPWRDSNSQSQQKSSCRSSPQITPLLGLVLIGIYNTIIIIYN